MPIKRKQLRDTKGRFTEGGKYSYGEIVLILLSVIVCSYAVLHAQLITYFEPKITYAKEPEVELQKKEVRIELTYTRERIVELIYETFPEAPKTALAIANAESRLNPKAYNPEWHYDKYGNPICQGSYGIMQVACIHVKDPNKLFDVRYNLEVASKIYNNSNSWLPWGAFTNGNYKKFLSET